MCVSISLSRVNILPLLCYLSISVRRNSSHRYPVGKILDKKACWMLWAIALNSLQFNGCASEDFPLSIASHILYDILGVEGQRQWDNKKWGQGERVEWGGWASQHWDHKFVGIEKSRPTSFRELHVYQSWSQEIQRTDIELTRNIDNLLTLSGLCCS